MVESYDSSPDKLSWTFVLRDGLKWHDGNPVTAEDCVVSLKRWSARDPLGKMLMADTASLDAADAKTLKLVLKQPFPLLLDVLGKPNAPLPVMMPARLARLGANGINASAISALMTAQTMIWLVMPCGRKPDGFTKVPASANAG